MIHEHLLQRVPEKVVKVWRSEFVAARGYG
jgi:hypothetical protein